MPARRQETEDGLRIGPALALAASLSWGFADFFGPLKGRSLGALRVLFGAQIGGLAAIGLVVAIRGKGPAGAGVLFAIPASLSGTSGSSRTTAGWRSGR